MLARTFSLFLTPIVSLGLGSQSMQDVGLKYSLKPQLRNGNKSMVPLADDASTCTSSSSFALGSGPDSLPITEVSTRFVMVVD